jgi:hypothetical protein
MTSMLIRDSTLESLTPRVNAPLDSVLAFTTYLVSTTLGELAPTLHMVPCSKVETLNYLF